MNGNAPFFRLYKRTSAKGNTYWAGRIGMAKCIAFPGKADDGTETLEVFLCGDQAVRDRAQRPAADSVQSHPGRPPQQQRRAAKPTPADVDGDGMDWEQGDPLPF